MKKYQHLVGDVGKGINSNVHINYLSNTGEKNHDWNRSNGHNQNNGPQGPCIFYYMSNFLYCICMTSSIYS